MKFRILYKFFALAFLAFVFQSRSAGPANVAGLQVTGAPGSTGSAGTCANSGCHVGSAFDASLSIELLDNDAVVDKYEPGKAYTIRVTIGNGSGSPSAYGYQATSLDASDNAIGTFDAGSAQQVVSFSGRDYLEHSSSASSGVFESTWTAPAAGGGAVTFYSAGIAGNGNGGTSGDGNASSTLTVDEDDANSTFSTNRDYATIEITQNPVVDLLKLEVTSRAAGKFDVRIADMSGKIIQTESVFLNSGENQESFSVANLESGFYVVQLSGENHVASVQMVKL